MRFEDLTTAVSSVVLNSLVTFINFIPSLLGGLIVLVIGLVLAAIAYRVIFGVLKMVIYSYTILKIIKLEKYFHLLFSWIISLN